MASRRLGRKRDTFGWAHPFSGVFVIFFPARALVRGSDEKLLTRIGENVYPGLIDNPPDGSVWVPEIVSWLVMLRFGTHG